MAQDTVPDASPSAPPAVGVPILALLFVGIFGVLLTSFPARNIDLWKHLADGRDLIRGAGGIGPTWLYDLAAYAVFSVAGGVGLAAVKALLCGLVAVLMLGLAGVRGGWRVPLAVTALAVLAMASRMLLQPATVSVLFLAVTVWLLVREETRSPEASGVWPGWRLFVLFAVWANIDERAVLGLAVVALTWLGRELDGRTSGGLGRRAVAFGILVAAACLSPSHVKGLRVPPDVRNAAVALWKRGENATVNSAFDRGYLVVFRESPAALAYYPLFALGVLSFLVNRGRWRWAWFLPWLGLAVVSGVQVRTVPLFAVVAGPVTAWNLREFFARRADPSPVRPRVRYAGPGLAFLLAAAFLVSAWPGWLQGPPFEPRRWAVEPPAALQQGAEFLRRTHAENLWAAESRTLHVSPETASAFAWFCPEDRGLRADDAIKLLLDPDHPDDARERLRKLAVSRVVVSAADPSDFSRAMLDRLLADPDEWPVLHLTGGLVVFGWRDPTAIGGNRYEGWEVDFDRLAFRPHESEVAPPGRPPANRRWWDAFWKPAPPPRPPGRDEANVLLRKAEALRQSAPVRHLAAWEASQLAGLVGAAGGWAGAHGPADAALRLTLFRPPIPENATPGSPLPPITRLTFALHQQFVADRGHTPVGVMYAAIRAGRRAVAENPGDANAHLALGRAYIALATTTAEQGWTARLPQLARLRQLQASAALNRAVALNPRLAPAQLELGRLYSALNCADLALFHLRAYRDIPARWGGPRKEDRQAKAVDSEIDRLTKVVEFQTREFARESEQSSVSDRALLAARRGLWGVARDLLLKSDIAAFGAAGMELELDLLLRTGRPDDVLEWMTPEVSGSLGDFSFRWLRAQALVAAGEYDAADDELAGLSGPGGRLPSVPEVGKEVGGLVGKSLLDEQFGGWELPQVVWRAVTQSDFRNRVTEITQTLSRHADVLVIRGIIALEAGNIGRAREAFRAALAFSPDRWGGGQLEFNGRSVAWDALGLIDAKVGR